MFIRRHVALGLFAFLFVLSANPEQAAASCDPADNVSWVQGGDHCLAIKTYLPSSGAAKTLLVTLHGDLSGGGKADYMFRVAEYAAEQGAVGVSMMRPGYTGDGRTSSGEATRRQDKSDWYNGKEMDSIAVAVKALKAHHGVERVVMLGHSGGATISGVLAGRAAPLVDAAILVSCPCYVAKWRDHRGRSPLYGAESPHDYIDKVPKTTKLIALTGDGDTNTESWLGRDYADEAKAAGLDATFILIPDAGHGFGRISRGADLFYAIRKVM